MDEPPPNYGTPSSKEASVEIVRKRFKVKFVKKLALTKLKLTLKRLGKMDFKCPVCNVEFGSTELIHDDFMDVVLKNVENDVEIVEVKDGEIVTVLEKRKPYETADEVIALSDDDEEEDSDVKLSNDDAGPSRKRAKKIVLSDEEDDPFHLSDFFDTEESGDEVFEVEGTANDPVVIDSD